ncbi:hypothetical protein HGG64_02135 [Mycoplasma phocoeninasale]|uniref:Type I restriction modification DNA specificity domain-containing protein n=1 Tax=Mycoplasma phocoeninasale TaxID=2726117 RepID=A0A858U3C8_9MOLU|nr:restriction endonuclease subunit S [Mycoplasma phocoeninasale]QJG66491.1 hypothetical protein HGG64_02135 [Mycoplasma phocoeninasale]
MKKIINEFKLYEICNIDRRLSGWKHNDQNRIINYVHVSAAIVNNIKNCGKGDIALSTTGPIFKFASEDYLESNDFINNGEVIFIPSGGVANIKYYNGQFIDAGNILMYKKNETVNLKYVYYWLKNNNDIINGYYRGAGIQHPDMLQLMNLKIKLPNINIQNEIVETIDKFYVIKENLKHKLTSEIELITEQYIYYFNKLLDFKRNISEHNSILANLLKKYNCNNIVWEKMSNLGTILGGLKGKSKTDFNNNLNSKYVPYKNIFKNMSVDQLDLDSVFVSPDEKQNNIKYGDILFTGSSETKDESVTSSVVCFEPNENIFLNSFCFIYRFNQNYFDPEFSKYLFRCKSLRDMLINCSFGTTRYNVSKKRILNIEIPIPPIEIQKEIVETLDKLSSYIDKLNNELLKEIELRDKQYQYYFNKLLDFDNNEVVDERK